MTIVSFSRNFIFIKTRKTGGTSVEIALAACCGPEDIVSPISLEDELLRVKDGVVAARNFAKPDVVEAYARAVIAEDKVGYQRARKYAREHGFHNHMAAESIKRRIDPGFWEQAFKFTAERHPYERTISRAYWKKSREAKDTAIEDLIDQCAGLSSTNYDLYSIDGKVVVDEFLRTETLTADLSRLANKLGFTIETPIPRAKGDVRLDRRPATEILSADQKDRIYNNQRVIFDLLNYQP